MTITNSINSHNHAVY